MTQNISNNSSIVNSMTSILIPDIAQLEFETRALKDEDSNTIANLDPNHAVLIASKAATARFLLNTDLTTIGRSKDADIMLDDHSVSREHAKIRRDGNKFYICDLGSLNGTYLNTKLIDCEILLQRGDEIQIGKYRLQFFPSPKA